MGRNFAILYNIYKKRVRLLALLLITLFIFVFMTTPQLQQRLTGRYLFLEKEGGVKEEKEGRVKEEEKVFDRVGEEITYDVFLGRVRLGKSQYRHLRRMKKEDQDVNQIIFETDIIKFHDLETIYCDVKTFLPVLIERKVSRMLKPERIEERYDQKNFTLTITKKRFTTESLSIKKDKPIHNSILLPYYVRVNADLKIGWSFEANLPQTSYLIKLVSAEEIEVPAGKFKAYRFESDPPRIQIWISADERRIPLRIEGTGALGYKLLMREYSFEKK